MYIVVKNYMPQTIYIDPLILKSTHDIPTTPIYFYGIKQPSVVKKKQDIIEASDTTIYILFAGKKQGYIPFECFGVTYPETNDPEEDILSEGLIQFGFVDGKISNVLNTEDITLIPTSMKEIEKMVRKQFMMIRSIEQVDALVGYKTYVLKHATMAMVKDDQDAFILLNNTISHAMLKPYLKSSFV